jgi:alpha-L-fucosidase 2
LLPRGGKALPSVYIVGGNGNARSDAMFNKLWYEQPAETWTEALPVGNGKLGAMVFGEVAHERIQFNEDTLWTGQPTDYLHPGASEALPRIRELLLAGRQAEAEALAMERFMSVPLGQFSYLPCGDLHIEMPTAEEVTEYTRELDLDSGVATTSWRADGTLYRRRVFASHPRNAIIVRIETDGVDRITAEVSLESPHGRIETSGQPETCGIAIAGQANDYAWHGKDDRASDKPASCLRFEARVHASVEGGQVQVVEDRLAITDARAVTLVLVAATSFVSYADTTADPAERCMKAMAKATAVGFADLQAEHLADHRSLFRRVTLDLGSSELECRPTDARIASFACDRDPSLVALFYQFGRYLLIACSRPGSQPANLQGVWNDQLAAPWDSKYTCNINTQMNYWPAEMGNLSECAEPLFAALEELAVTGAEVAREHYGARGWVVHHNFDLWRGAAPINNANHGIWPTGGAWLCQHLWWHYQFTGDRGFLARTAYPLMRGACEFFLDTLVEDPRDEGRRLISGPSNSPEQGGLVMGPTMDHQIIRALFASTAGAAERLGVDADFAQTLRETRDRIAPNQIGRHGQLQEWLEDVDEPTNEHRHVSHLWGLHPGEEIGPIQTPELAQACRVTLAHRSDGGTGWSRAWKINFWARLLDGDHAFELLRNLLVPAGTSHLGGHSGGVYANLFDAHPPFQIDGNFGATSGITEMLLQSQRRQSERFVLHLLPALPSALDGGTVTGLRARGGFEVDIRWAKGELVSARIASFLGKPVLVQYGDALLGLDVPAGNDCEVTAADFLAADRA